MLAISVRRSNGYDCCYNITAILFVYRIINVESPAVRTGVSVFQCLANVVGIRVFGFCLREIGRPRDSCLGGCAVGLVVGSASPLGSAAVPPDPLHPVRSRLTITTMPQNVQKIFLHAGFICASCKQLHRRLYEYHRAYLESKNHTGLFL